jgi:hypothetical protein
MSDYLALQEWSANLLGACADRANITMEGALYAKRRHGATASDLGHQQFAPMGENHFRALARSPQKATADTETCLNA